jgi:hypothetical protein
MSSAARGGCAAAGISASTRMASKAEPRDAKLFKVNPLKEGFYLIACLGVGERTALFG